VSGVQGSARPSLSGASAVPLWYPPAGWRARRRPPGSPWPAHPLEEGADLDPVTHTFVGASLSAAGLRRTTALATPTLILAANAPDVDVFTHATGAYAALAWRRGITHGIPALVILPFLVAAVVLAWDRWVRRRRDPVPPAAHPALGVWTHPALDWVNTYGMRWLMPISDRWSYGDAVFILDPWIWLLLGGALFVVHSSTRRAVAAWAGLGGAMTLLLFLADGVPTGARVVWVVGVVGWILVRLGPGSPTTLAGMADRARERRRAGIVRCTLGVTTAYLLLMIAQTPLADRVVRSEARALGIEGIERTMVGPVPAHPLRGEVILETTAGYRRGTFSWVHSPRLRLEPDLLPLDPPNPVVSAAATHPEARHFLIWSRFPWTRIEPVAEGWIVHFHDVRYLDRGSAGALAGIRIQVDPDFGTRRLPP